MVEDNGIRRVQLNVGRYSTPMGELIVDANELGEPKISFHPKGQPSIVNWEFNVNGKFNRFSVDHENVDIPNPRQKILDDVIVVTRDIESSYMGTVKRRVLASGIVVMTSPEFADQDDSVVEGNLGYIDREFWNTRMAPVIRVEG